MKNVKTQQSVCAHQFPPSNSKRTRCPTNGMAEMMLVPTVMAQNASWSHGSR